MRSLRASRLPEMSDEPSLVQVMPRGRTSPESSISFRNGCELSGSTIQIEALALPGTLTAVAARRLAPTPGTRGSERDQSSLLPALSVGSERMRDTLQKISRNSGVRSTPSPEKASRKDGHRAIGLGNAWGSSAPPCRREIGGTINPHPVTLRRLRPCGAKRFARPLLRRRRLPEHPACPAPLHCQQRADALPGPPRIRASASPSIQHARTASGCGIPDDQGARAERAA